MNSDDWTQLLDPILKCLEEAAETIGEIEHRLPTGGRPRQLSVFTLFAGWLMVFCDDQKPLLTKVTKMLNRVPDKYASLIGLTDQNGERINVTYRKVRYRFQQVVSIMDATPNLLRKKGESDKDWQRRVKAAQLQGTEASTAQDLLDLTSFNLLYASIDDEYRQHRNFAVDWTDADSAAAGYKKPPADVSAGWGRRRSRTPGSKSEIFFGYNETVVTAVPGEGPPVPQLVFAATLDKPPVNKKGQTQTQVDDRSASASKRLLPLLESHIDPGLLIADTAYSHSRGWTDFVVSHGWDPVFELHPNDQGLRGHHGPTYILNGSFYCPRLPESLYDIPKVTTNTPKAKKPGLLKKLAKRDEYRWKLHEYPDADGYYRIRHPETDDIDDDGKPNCCGQWTLRVPPHLPGKTRQHYVYQSEQWREIYDQRTFVEQSNSRIKDPAKENLGQKRSVRVIGRAPNQLIRTFGWMSVNIRSQASFKRNQEEERARAKAEEGQPKRRRKRRSVTLETMREAATKRPAA